MEDGHKCPPPGLPPWMATFSDLMTLLMCFFVLLLSFSEMDVLKFKQIAGSMKFAFGVQNMLEVKDIPKGTSVIAQEFRPGRPEPTPIEVIMQQTIDMTNRSLDFHDGDSARAGGTMRDAGDKNGGKHADTSVLDLDTESAEEPSEAQNKLKNSLEIALNREIEEGSIELENLGQQLVIRIKEKGAFPEGSAFLQPKFRPLVRQVAELVKDVPGIVRVSGHSDNRKLDSELYRSNWDLSAQRAVSVAQEMEKVKGFDHMRLRVLGLADTHPLNKNKTPAERKANRRVEISVMQGEPYYTDEIPSEASKTK
ncbi:flagellar motor protein MotB [Photobacterium aquae]|uniref:Flagellar motor protein MotB n=1 Tax=Photobacterium aquae TaxID=1195763 RepID=A0A0J1JUH1_9GAMM|nr:flagellar motor protein MotB [Photobacterium aquae]KLV05952.1 flagellar motor protein MotB [Photobacterium aquae]